MVFTGAAPAPAGVGDICVHMCTPASLCLPLPSVRGGGQAWGQRRGGGGLYLGKWGRRGSASDIFQCDGCDMGKAGSSLQVTSGRLPTPSWLERKARCLYVSLPVQLFIHLILSIMVHCSLCAVLCNCCVYCASYGINLHQFVADDTRRWRPSAAAAAREPRCAAPCRGRGSRSNVWEAGDTSPRPFKPFQAASFHTLGGKVVERSCRGR